MSDYHLYLEHHLKQCARMHGCLYKKDFSTEIQDGELLHVCRISIRNDGLMIATGVYKSLNKEVSEKEAIHHLLTSILMYSFDKMTSGVKNLPDNLKDIFLDEL